MKKLKSKNVASTVVAFIKDEKENRRKRPNRRSIEAKLKKEYRVNQKELNAALIEMYDQLVSLGVVNAR